VGKNRGKRVESEMGRGIFVDRSEAEGTTLYEALERYEREVSKAKKGHEQEKWRIKAWKADSLAKRSLASLRGADFSKWRDARLESVSPATVRLELALLSHFFTYAAKEWGIGVTNPVQSIRMPKVSNARERRLEGTEENISCMHWLIQGQENELTTGCIRLRYWQSRQE
jgi:hypothetical protein